MSYMLSHSTLWRKPACPAWTARGQQRCLVEIPRGINISFEASLSSVAMAAAIPARCLPHTAHLKWLHRSLSQLHVHMVTNTLWWCHWAVVWKVEINILAGVIVTGWRGPGWRGALFLFPCRSHCTWTATPWPSWSCCLLGLCCRTAFAVTMLHSYRSSAGHSCIDFCR